jgi:hypothetical protein
MFEAKDPFGRRITLAPQQKIDSIPWSRIEKLLVAIAPFMTDKDPVLWANSCLITDESSISDFLNDDDIRMLCDRLNLPIEGEMYIWQVVERMPL